MSRQWRLACLLHDAAEFVIGDMITPFKTILADEYKAVESRLTVAVHIRFGLPGCCPIMSTRRSSAPIRSPPFSKPHNSPVSVKPKPVRPLHGRVMCRPSNKTATTQDAAEAYLRRFKYLGERSTATRSGRRDARIILLFAFENTA